MTEVKRVKVATFFSLYGVGRKETSEEITYASVSTLRASQVNLGARCPNSPIFDDIVSLGIDVLFQFSHVLFDIRPDLFHLGRDLVSRDLSQPFMSRRFTGGAFTQPREQLGVTTLSFYWLLLLLRVTTRSLRIAVQSRRRTRVELTTSRVRVRQEQTRLSEWRRD